MTVNSAVVEGPEGLVVVDGQLTVSDARLVRKVIDELDRPVAGLLLTHPHPDHYAGAATILDGLEAPIIATEAVAEVIQRDDDLKNEIVGPMMGEEWPTHRRLPDELVASGQSIALAGLTFDVTDLGPAESHADALWALGDHLFIGDVVYNDMHAYLADARHVEWLRLLERLEAEIAADAVLHVGHGPSVTRSALETQRRYVEAFVGAVDSTRSLAPDDRHGAVVQTMAEQVSTDALQFLMELSIEPVLAAMKEQR